MSESSVKTDYGILETQLNERVSVVKRTAEVELKISGVPAKFAFAKTLVSALSSAVVRELPETLSVDRVAEAFEALLYLRVLQVNGRWLRDHPALHYKKVRYPAFLFPLLRAIGEVDDKADAVHVSVSTSPSMERFSKDDYDWSKVEETLSDLDDYGVRNGLEMAEALPKARDGRLTVMVLLVEGNRLVSAKGDANPADLLIRSALDFTITDYVWGTLRWEYQSVDEYDQQYKQLIRSTFRIAI